MHSYESGNWIVGAPSGRVAMLRNGKCGELVKVFITTMAGSSESC